MPAELKAAINGSRAFADRIRVLRVLGLPHDRLDAAITQALAEERTATLDEWDAQRRAFLAVNPEQPVPIRWSADPWTFGKFTLHLMSTGGGEIADPLAEEKCKAEIADIVPRVGGVWPRFLTDTTSGEAGCAARTLHVAGWRAHMTIEEARSLLHEHNRILLAQGALMQDANYRGMYQGVLMFEVHGMEGSTFHAAGSDVRPKPPTFRLSLA